MPCNLPACPVIYSGDVPVSDVLITAPIFARGSVTRFIGRFESDSSPVKTQSKSCPASSPLKRRIDVPELPK